jgi:hypothetical protein
MTDWNVAITFLVFMGTVLGAVWGHSLWLSKQFSSLRELIYKQTKAIEENFFSKLEYHERHDDNRFIDLRNELWELRLRNAEIQGTLLENVKKTQGHLSGETISKRTG